MLNDKFATHLVLTLAFQIVGVVANEQYLSQAVMMAFTLLLLLIRLKLKNDSQIKPLKKLAMKLTMQIFLGGLLCFSTFPEESNSIRLFLYALQLQSNRILKQGFQRSAFLLAKQASIMIWMIWQIRARQKLQLIGWGTLMGLILLQQSIYFFICQRRRQSSLTPSFQNRCQTEPNQIDENVHIQLIIQTPEVKEIQLNPYFYKEILKSFSDGVIIMDLQEEVLFVGQSVCGLMNKKEQADAVEQVMNLKNCQEEFLRQSQMASLFGRVIKKTGSKFDAEDYEDEGGSPQMNDIDFQEFVSESNNVRQEYERIVKCRSDQATYVEDGQHIVFIQEVRMICSIDGMIADRFDGQQPNLYQVSMKLFSCQGRVLFLMVIKDVTHFNQIRALRAINENKSHMLSQVSHEFRTPLNCIILLVEDLIKQSSDHINYYYLRPVLTSAKALLSLIHDLLDLAQLKAGKFKLMYCEFDLKELFTELKVFLEPNVQLKGNKIELALPQNIQYLLVSDASRIRQILINLIGNSAKFTKNGTITIGATMEKPDLVQLFVEDTGIGIQEQDQLKLFEAFGKLDHGKELNTHGVGLGLMISNILAERLSKIEGDIGKGIGLQVYSAGKGKGSRFTFFVQNQSRSWSSKHFVKKATLQYIKKSQFDQASIRLNEGVLSNTSSIQDQLVASKVSLELVRVKSIQKSDIFSLRISAQRVSSKQFDWKSCECPAILIVDDTVLNIVALCGVLKNYNLRIDQASSGTEALEKVREYEVNNICKEGYNCNQYGLILMDIEMDDMDGITASREILKISRDNKIVGCSGHDDKQTEALCLQAGMIGYLTKPVEVKKLIEILQNLKLL